MRNVTMIIKDIFQSGKTVLSCEVFPPKRNDDIYGIFRTLDEIQPYHPDFISVTYGAGGGTSKKTATIAAYIQNICEIEALAHLTSVAMDEAFLRQMVCELNKKGVHNVLALRGDQPKDMSDEAFQNRHFQHASDIIPIIRDAAQNDICIAAACYPEKHPESASVEEDLIHLKQKADTGVNFFITQMFFDNYKFLKFREAARAYGIQVPISAGIMPITSASQIGTSVQLSGSSVPTGLSNLLAKYGDNPEDMRKAGIDYAVRQINELIREDVDGIHIYTMNKSTVTREIFGQIHIKG